MKRYRAHAIFFLILLVFIASRFVHLDADPPPTKWYGDIGEEGFWGAAPRDTVLFGGWQFDDYIKQHVMLIAPLYFLMQTAIFKIFGVGLVQLRLLPAIFGVLSLVIVYWFVQRKSKPVALLAAFFLTLNDSFFAYNRINFVETALIFFIALSAIFLGLAKDRKLLVFLSGAAFSTAVLVKISGLHFMLALLIIYAAGILQKQIKNNIKNHAVNGLCFFSGALLSSAAMLLFFYAPNWNEFSAIYGAWNSTLQSEVSPFGNLFNLVASPFFSSFSVAVLFFFSMLFLLQLRKEEFQHAPDYIIFALALFFATFIDALFSNFSERRFVPLLIPLSILAAAQIARKPEAGPAANSGANSLALSLFVAIIAQQAFEKLGLMHYYKAVPIIFLVLSVFLITAKSAMGKYLNYPKLLLCALWFVLFSQFLKLIAFNIFGSSSRTLPIIIALASLVFIYAFSYNAGFQKVLLYAFVIFNVILIASALLHPDYSIRDASIKLAGIAGNGVVTGPPAYHFSYAGNYTPLWYSPHHKFFGKINDGKKEKFEYLLVRQDYEKEGYAYLRPSETNAAYVDSIRVLRGRYQYELYEIIHG